MKRTRTTLLLAMSLLAAFIGDSTRTSHPAVVDDFASANPLHAARLRKLHLVRPDLINYPLAFDVVC